MKTISQFKSINSFTTNRLIAERVQANDFEKIRSLHTNKDVMKTLGGVLLSDEQTLENLNWNLKQWDDNGFGLWMFYLKDTKEWIGRCGLRRVLVDGNAEVEIGYALLPQFWNHGFATEMTQACIEIAFEVLQLKDIVCFTLTTNKASQRVMEKAGFKYERDIIHVELPHVLYRIRNPRRIEVVPYSKNWPEFFAKEVRRIEQVFAGDPSRMKLALDDSSDKDPSQTESTLDDNVVKIHHIGSTSIPNMPAKPVIDMLLEFENLDEIDDIAEKLNSIGFYNLRKNVIPHRSFFTYRQDETMRYHLHIFERGDPQIKRHVHFKDYLIHHPDDAKTYAQLKQNLAMQFADDSYQYVLGKDKLVQEIDHKAKLWTERQRDFLPQNTGPKTNKWPQEKIIKAMEANLNVHMTHFAQYINEILLVRIPGYTLVNSNLNDDTFNYVLRTDATNYDADKKIAEVLEHFSKTNVHFFWLISPYDQPANLAEKLEQAGLVNIKNNIGMYIDLDEWQNSFSKSDLEIKKVIDKKGLQDFAEILGNDEAIQYYTWVADVLTEDDPVEFYVGYDNGKPVAHGQIVYYAQVAGLYSVSTVAHERDKNYGFTLEQFLLRRAKELGFHIAVLQTSQENLSLYLQQGFKECCWFKEISGCQLVRV